MRKQSPKLGKIINLVPVRGVWQRPDPDNTVTDAVYGKIPVRGDLLYGWSMLREPKNGYLITRAIS